MCNNWGKTGSIHSKQGREVLIKSIIQAVPTYTMGCFKIPLGLCHDIEALIKKKKKKNCWGQQGDHRKIHWLIWDEFTKSKMVGGMGFRDLALYNDSHLAKQAWHLLYNRSSLFIRCSKHGFFQIVPL